MQLWEEHEPNHARFIEHIDKAIDTIPAVRCSRFIGRIVLAWWRRTLEGN